MLFGRMRALKSMHLHSLTSGPRSVASTSDPTAHVADTWSAPGSAAGSGLLVVNRHDFDVPEVMFVP